MPLQYFSRKWRKFKFISKQFISTASILDIRECLFTLNPISIAFYVSLIYLILAVYYYRNPYFYSKIKYISAFMTSSIGSLILFLMIKNSFSFPIQLATKFLDYGETNRIFLLAYFSIAIVPIFLLLLSHKLSLTDYAFNLLAFLIFFFISKKFLGSILYNYGLIRSNPFKLYMRTKYSLAATIVFAFSLFYLSIYLMQLLISQIKSISRKIKRCGDSF